MKAPEQAPEPAIGSAPGWPLVLYYHHVHPTLRHYCSVTPSDLRRGLELVLSAFEGGSQDPHCAASRVVGGGDRPSVLVTFDDGYADVLDHGLAVLDDLGVKAVMFLVTSWVGRRTPDTSQSCMTWADARSLAAQGHVIGAHTVTHPKLSALDGGCQTSQIEGSVAKVSSEVGGCVPFAYPYGVKGECSPGDERSAFGSVKAAARPWDDQHAEIRRTYLPTGAPERWPGLIANWRTQWER